MGQSTFSGPVKSLAGFISSGVSNSVTTGAAAISLDVANYSGKQIYYTSTAASTFTLPAVNNTTPNDPTDPNQLNNYGATFNFVLSTTVTGSFIVKVANASDTMVGTAILGSGTTALVFSTATASDTITLSGTTTGGVGGATITATVVGANRYKVNVVSGATGAVATPFSATV